MTDDTQLPPGRLVVRPITDSEREQLIRRLKEEM
jgi:hypothetical protein